MKLRIRNMTEQEAAALSAARGMTLGQYFRAGGAEAMLTEKRRKERTFRRDAST